MQERAKNAGMLLIFNRHQHLRLYAQIVGLFALAILTSTSAWSSSLMIVVVLERRVDDGMARCSTGVSFDLASRPPSLELFARFLSLRLTAFALSQSLPS
jgi:hypothetical protein